MPPVFFEATRRNNNTMAPNSHFATEEQSAPNKMPIVTPGDLTPKMLCSFKIFCKAYFNNKGIPSMEQVEKIALSFQDAQVQNWCMSNKTRINTMTFKEYMAELQKMWLPSNWEATQ